MVVFIVADVVDEARDSKCDMNDRMAQPKESDCTARVRRECMR
jgi:hypothetical protein